MAGQPISFDLLRVGHCTHPECVAMRGGRFKSIEFPALVGLMRHPSLGYVLYDTGYSRHFWEATRTFPECLYRMITPPALPPEEELIHQLEQRNIRPEQIGSIIISHFHADHVAGLRDFPKARFIATRDEFREMRGKGRVARLRGAFLTKLLPDDFESRVSWAEDQPVVDPGLVGFNEAYDLAGDASLLGIPLPGHARSQLGLLFRAGERRTFLIGDACWQMEALERGKLPSRVTKLLFADNRRYADTFFRLADLHRSDPAVTIIPSHCATTWRRHGNSRQVVHA
ncbi:MAG: MBL fold metallo-hydrolase [Verrucomicrobiaceae bacterium]|nr:MAG: MBL fold metallo-hydrolase [Verrucomicrobiaceae bacterium]